MSSVSAWSRHISERLTKNKQARWTKAAPSQWSRLLPNFRPSCRAAMARLKCSFRFWISRSLRTFIPLSSSWISAYRSHARRFSYRSENGRHVLKKLGHWKIVGAHLLNVSKVWDYEDQHSVVFNQECQLQWTRAYRTKTHTQVKHCTVLRNCSSFLKQLISLCRYSISFSFILRRT